LFSSSPKLEDRLHTGSPSRASAWGLAPVACSQVRKASSMQSES
jgi:hypothetical protein